MGTTTYEWKKTSAVCCKQYDRTVFACDKISFVCLIVKGIVFTMKVLTAHVTCVSSYKVVTMDKLIQYCLYREFHAKKQNKKTPKKPKNQEPLCSCQHVFSHVTLQPKYRKSFAFYYYFAGLVLKSCQFMSVIVIQIHTENQ